MNIAHLSQLPPFQFSSSVGPKPNLPRRVAFSQVDTDQNHLEVAAGMQKACADRGVEFIQANAMSSLSTQVTNIESFLQRGVGGLFMFQIGGMGANVYQQILDTGLCLANENAGPSTIQLAANQYEIGYSSGQAAAEWFKRNMPGTQVKVAYLNPNALAPVLVARTTGALKALGRNPQITIVNIGLTTPQWTPTGGYQVTSALIQRHPDLAGIVSGDAVIEGAVKSLQAAGNNSVKYIGGVDGEDAVLSAIEAGGLIKNTFGFAQGVQGYAPGQFMADWLDGKNVPQAIVLQAVKLDSATAIKTYRDQNNSPAQYWKDPKYLQFLGNISYQARNQWVRNTLVY